MCLTCCGACCGLAAGSVLHCGCAHHGSNSHEGEHLCGECVHASAHNLTVCDPSHCSGAQFGFLLFRVVWSLIQSVHIVLSYDQYKHLPVYIPVPAITPPVMFVLNAYWFFRITVTVLQTLKKPKPVDTATPGTRSNKPKPVHGA